MKKLSRICPRCGQTVPHWDIIDGRGCISCELLWLAKKASDFCLMTSNEQTVRLALIRHNLTHLLSHLEKASKEVWKPERSKRNGK